MAEVAEAPRGAAAINALQKRKITHDRILTDFEQRIRKDSIESENTILLLCNELKKALVLSTTQIEERSPAACRELRQQVADGMLFLEGPPPDPTRAVLPTLQSCAEEPLRVATEGLKATGAGPPSPFRITLNRILAVKHRMLGIYAEITESTAWRLRCISKFIEDLHTANTRRRERLEEALSEMISALRSVGWADEKQCALLIQEKGTDINVSITANSRAASDLVGRLHIRETQIQERLVGMFSEAWTDLLDTMSTSCLDWLHRRMSSSAYSNPPERGALISSFFADLMGPDLWGKIESYRPDGSATTAGDPDAPPGGRTTQTRTPTQMLEALSEAVHQLAIKVSARDDTQIPSERFNGAPPQGLHGMLRSNLVAVFGLITTVDPQHGSRRVEQQQAQGDTSAMSMWPLPGGTSGDNAWLASWQAPRDPTGESLQLAHRVDLEELRQKASAAASASRIDEWKNALQLFLVRLQALQAEFLSRAICQEEQLSQHAGNDANMLLDDLRSILRFATSFPQPAKLTHTGAVSLVDCMGHPLHLSPAEGTSGVTLCSADGDTPAFVMYIHASRQLCRWGDVRDLVVYVGASPQGVEGQAEAEAAADSKEVHRFTFSGSGQAGEGVVGQGQLDALQALLDACGVGHNLEDGGILSRHIQECDGLLSDTRERQAGLVRYFEDEGCREAMEEPLVPESEEAAKWASVLERRSAITDQRFTAISQDSGLFLRLLRHAMEEQVWQLSTALLTSPQSLLSNMKGAELFLHRAASALHNVTHVHRQDYLVLELDFQDTHAQMEDDYKNFVDELLRAPDRAVATDKYRQALQVLQDIEVLYCKVKAQKEDALGCLKDSVADTSASLAQDLYEALQVVPCRVDEEGVPVPLAAQAQESRPGTEATAHTTKTTPQVDASSCPMVKSRAGEALLQLAPPKDILLGSQDPKAVPCPERPAPPMLLYEKDAPRPVTPEVEQAPAKGKAPPGKKGAAPAEEPAKSGDAAAREEAVRQAEVAAKRVGQHIRLLECDVFKVATANDVILAHLRSTLVDWLSAFTSSLVASVEKYCHEHSAGLELWLSERLRQHQRRMPSLAAQEYDTRMRELVESGELKQREFSWIGKRFSANVDTAKESLENHQSAFDKEIKQLRAHTARLPSVANLPAMQVNKKTAEADYASLQRRAKATCTKIDAMLAKAKVALGKEGERYLAEHCKTFENGGLLSPEEYASNQEAVRALENSACEEIEEQRKACRATCEQQQQTIQAELDVYTKAYQDNHADLSFLKWQNEALAAVKGGINVCIAGSQEAERRLDASVAELEERVKSLATKTHGTQCIARMKVREDVPDMPDLPDDTTDAVDTVLSTRLRKAKISREAQIREIPAFHLIQHLDSLSRTMHSRATFLGVLKQAMALPSVPPHTYFSQREEGDASSSDRATPVRPAAEVVEGHVAAFWERAGDALKKYYAELGGRSITRPTLIQPSEAEQKELLTQKVQEVSSLLQAHLDTAVPTFRTHVARVALAAPRVPNEVFCGLYNLAFSFLEGTVGTCKDLFDGLYSRSAASRKAHGSRVKGCMTNPGNRNVIEETRDAESVRHETSKRLVTMFHGVLLREEVAISEAFNKQACQASATLFKIFTTLLTTDMLTAQGGDVSGVGTHRSLKRLRIAKQRKEANASNIALAEAANNAKAPPKAGKPPPKGAKEAKQEEAAPADPRRYVAYPGMSLEPPKGFATFLEQHPGLSITDHLGEGVKPVEPVDPAPPKPGGKKGPGRATPDKLKGSAPPEEEAPSMSATLEGPDETLFKTVVQQRNQCVVAMQQYHSGQVERVNQLFEELLQVEEAWFTSWEGLLATLIPAS